MNDSSSTPTPGTPDPGGARRRRGSAFLPIGITFIAVGLAMLIGPASASAWAFLPIGITFLILGLSNDRADRADARDTRGANDSPDTPDAP